MAHIEQPTCQPMQVHRQRSCSQASGPEEKPVIKPPDGTWVKIQPPDGRVTLGINLKCWEKHSYLNPAVWHIG